MWVRDELGGFREHAGDGSVWSSMLHSLPLPTIPSHCPQESYSTIETLQSTANVQATTGYFVQEDETLARAGMSSHGELEGTCCIRTENHYAVGRAGVSPMPMEEANDSIRANVTGVQWHVPFSCHGHGFVWVILGAGRPMRQCVPHMLWPVFEDPIQHFLVSNLG